MYKKILSVVALMFASSLSFSQEFSLYQQFYGHYDFTMIGNTLNYDANSSITSTCDILTESSARLELENDQIVKSAYLYWSGPGSLHQADLDVKLNEVPITSERTYYLSFSVTGGALGMFGAFADVTSLVKDFGNTDYTLSELDFRSLIPVYCEHGINYGGWAIIIVYEQASLPKNLVTVYDGFTGIDGGNPDVTIHLDGFEVTDVNDSKIGFLVWEGDAGISNEQLRINNYIASNAINPPNNPFNSTNSFTNSTELWNMDLDYYMMDDYISEGDTSVEVQVITAGDVVILNGIALSFGSILPDATIDIDKVDITCFSRTINLHYTVSNINGEHLLKKGTPIAFYIGEELIGTDETAFDVPIGGSISGNILLPTPNNYGIKFEVTAVVDDDGTGKGMIFEIDEENNTDNFLVNLLDGCHIQKGISPNGDGLNDGFDLEIFNLIDLKIYNRYGSLVYQHGEGYTNQWKGQDKSGKLLPAGTYYYVFTTSYDTYSGYVYVIREVR